MNDNRTEYLEQLRKVIKEMKKLKEIRRLNGDQDALDEIRKVTEIFTHIDYDFSVGVREIHKIWGYYILNSGVSDKEKENNYSFQSTFSPDEDTEPFRLPPKQPDIF